MEYQNGQPLLGRAPAGAHGPNLERISRRQVTVPVWAANRPESSASPGRAGDVWHLDEVVVKILGRSFRLWRAVDQHGVVLEEFLQSKRDKQAAKWLLISLIKRHGFVQKRIVTDKLRSYGAAKREVAAYLDHWSHKGLNHCAETSHLPFRKRERTMQGSGLRVGCNASFPSTQAPEIAFPFHAVVALP